MFRSNIDCILRSKMAHAHVSSGFAGRAECSAMQTTQQTHIAVAASANAAGVHAVVVVVVVAAAAAAAAGATAAAAAESIAAARGATGTYEFTTQPATTN